MAEKKVTIVERLAVVETQMLAVEGMLKNQNKLMVAIIITVLLTNADKIPTLLHAFNGTALAGN